jgi:anti-anti-sigma regulatory factor
MRTQVGLQERDGMTAAIRNGTLVLRGDLDFNHRREFLAATQCAIERGDATVRLNCSTVDVTGPVSDGVVGMLVALTRAAQSRGARLELVRAPQRMRAQFDTAGVAGLFDWRG